MVHQCPPETDCSAYLRRTGTLHLKGYIQVWCICRIKAV